MVVMGCEGCNDVKHAIIVLNILVCYDIILQLINSNDLYKKKLCVNNGVHLYRKNGGYWQKYFEYTHTVGTLK